MLSDAELLGRYSRGRDEQAFAEVVDRYLNLVYSAALRHSDGDPGMAEEVSQNVFSALARKSSELAGKLERGQPLAAWLYTSAHFAASSLRRTENRRQNRERATQAETETAYIPESEFEPEWAAIRPLIDEAMRDLTATDRDAILLRYFAGQDLRSVGSTVGLTEDAVRKRIDRALDRLREWLAIRGIKTTGAALAATLASRAAQLVPAGLAASISRNAVVGATLPSPTISTGSVLRTFAPARPAITVAVVSGLLLAVGWLGFSNRPSINSLEASIDSTNAGSGVAIAPSTSVAVASRPTFQSSRPARSSLKETVRVSKSFLERIPLQPVTMSFDGKRSLTVTETFVRLFRLTANEVEQLNSAIAAAQHRYRVEEGHHLRLTDSVIKDPASAREAQLGITPNEQFSFHLDPFPERREALRQTFEAEVNRILGAERASYFVKTAVGIGPLAGGENDTNSPIYTFRLTDRDPLPVVDLHQYNGNGLIGIDYEAPLDEYAPESLKPMLARWRAWIGEETLKRKASLPSNAGAAPVEDSEDAKILPAPADQGPWDDRASYVDIPIRLIKSLKIAGITPEETVSLEAVELCELTASESDAVHSLYAEMKTRFKAVERERFGRVQAGKNKFIMRAFPEEADALRAEWSAKLNDLLGENRGELLDELARTPFSLVYYIQRHRDFSPMIEADVDWLRGKTETIEIEIDPDSKSVRFRSQTPDGAGGSFSPFDPDHVPKRWRHLLTRDLVIWP